MFAQIKRVSGQFLSKIKSYFSHDPYQPYQEAFNGIEALQKQLDDLRLKELDPEIPMDEEIEQPQVDDSKEQEEYKLIIVGVYDVLTPKQRQFYKLISFEEFKQVKKALQNQYKRLKNGQWLNDEIINDYIKSIECTEGVCIFNSFHYGLLIKANQNAFNRISKKAGVNESTKIILIPFNSHNTHWFLLKIDFVEQQIQIYDSMTKRNYQPLFEEIDELAQRYKQFEYTYLIQQCPQQDNSYDCGVFTLKNIQILAKYPDARLDDYYNQSTIFYDRLSICKQLLS